MLVESSRVNWQSQHSASSARSTQVQINASRGGQQVSVTTSAAMAEAVRVSINAQATAAAQASQLPTFDPPAVKDAVQTAFDEAEDSPKIRMIRAVVEILSGRPVETIKASDVQGEHPHAAPADSARSTSMSPVAVRIGTGMSVTTVNTYTEQESTAVQAQAEVHTADGRTLAVGISLAMARSYREQSSVTIQIGEQPKAKDPLVLNFDGHAAELTDQTFRFDLNGDGQAEDIAMLGAHSGYLALDVNGNGQIDSGKELFGPATGQGFQELAAYDQDGNGWIDEGDAVFKRLQVWKPAGATLQSAQSLGVGAISLSTTTSPFELRNSANQSLGTVRSTGMYLMENGSAGSIQQIDLVV